MIQNHSPSQLQAAVAAICPEIHARVTATARPTLREPELWRQLSCCLLSSQVPYPLAQAAADAIDASGALSSLEWTSEPLQRKLQAILSRPVLVDSRWRHYRFPIARSEQLARTRTAVTAHAGALSSVLEGCEDEYEARSWFVTYAPGVGPKQASMFLRNVGISYNLAILDRHVLNYMDAVGLQGSRRHDGGGGLQSYLSSETVLQRHAADMGYPVGLLDWAIWIVMRAVNQGE